MLCERKGPVCGISPGPHLTVVRFYRRAFSKGIPLESQVPMWSPRMAARKTVFGGAVKMQGMCQSPRSEEGLFRPTEKQVSQIEAIGSRKEYLITATVNGRQC